MSNKEQSPAEILRERFRAELKKPVSERYFSEDDLVNVFDTSGDTYDDYLRAEALILGARLYPDSIALLERRAIFYLDTDKELFVNFMEDYGDTPSDIIGILRLNLLEGQSTQKIESEIEEFLKGFKFSDDEQVIQFVQTLNSLGMDKWLVDNLSEMKARVPYLPTLLYEYAILSENSETLAAVAVPVLEELIETEPYVADYWTMMALAYAREGRSSDASNAIDYALAIEPDNYQALKTKLHLSNIEGDGDTFRRILQKLVELNPDDPETAAMSVLDFDAENRHVLFQYIDALSPAARANRTVVMKAISSGYPALEQLLSDLYDRGIRSSDDWRSLAEFAYDFGNTAAVNVILRVYEEKAGEPLNHDFLMFRILFDMHSYELAAKVFTDAEPGGTLRLPENLFSGYSMFLLSLLRIGEFVSAENAARSFLKVLDEDSDMFGSEFEKYGMRKYLEDILKRLKSKKPTDWSTFSPIK